MKIDRKILINFIIDLLKVDIWLLAWVYQTQASLLFWESSWSWVKPLSQMAKLPRKEQLQSSLHLSLQFFLFSPIPWRHNPQVNLNHTFVCTFSTYIFCLKFNPICGRVEIIHCSGVRVVQLKICSSDIVFNGLILCCWNLGEKACLK